MISKPKGAQGIPFSNDMEEVIATQMEKEIGELEKEIGEEILNKTIKSMIKTRTGDVILEFNSTEMASSLQQPRTKARLLELPGENENDKVQQYNYRILIKFVPVFYQINDKNTKQFAKTTTLKERRSKACDRCMR